MNIYNFSLLQERKRNTDFHVFELHAKTNQMESIHRNEQTSWYLLADNSGYLVLLVCVHQQHISLYNFKFIVSYFTRVYIGHFGCHHWTKTNVSNKINNLILCI